MGINAGWLHTIGLGILFGFGFAIGNAIASALCGLVQRKPKT